jgi:hypothetical protein
MTEQQDAPDATDAERPEDRYGAIETGGGATIIYDRETPEAWVQSNLVVRPEA